MKPRNGKKSRQVASGTGSSASELLPSSSNQLSTEEMNPMLNSVVLKIVFEYCDLTELLEYRLVSKEWYSSSLARIRNEMTVEITDDPSQRWKLNWANLHKKLNIGGDVSFRCFRVLNMDFMNPPPPAVSRPPVCSRRTKDLASKMNISMRQIYRNIEQFWGDYGPSMTKLDLQSVTIYSVEAFKKAIFQDTPNLEELKIGSLTLEGGAEGMKTKGDDEIGMVQLKLKALNVPTYRFPIPWRHVFLQYPNIEKLKLHNPTDTILPLVEMLETLDVIPLKELNFGNLTQNDASSLKRLFRLRKLKLTKLKMDGDWDFGVEEWNNTLKLVMQTQGESLKMLKLSIRFDDDNFDPTKSFPYQCSTTLEQLTQLTLDGPAFKNFHFLSQTPNLRELEVWTFDDDDVDLQIGLESVKNVVLPHLTKFWFEYKYLSEEEMKILVKIMPNLEMFRGKTDPSGLRLIFNNWQKLKNLEISCDDIDDEALTGIAKGGNSHLPNITDLKNLREFRIFSDDPAEIGDSSIWNGFIKLPFLHYLTLMLSSKTSQKAIDALLKQVTDGEVFRGTGKSVCGCGMHGRVRLI